MAAAESTKTRSGSRSEARRRALQALYQWELGGESAAAIEREFFANEERDMQRADAGYFHTLVYGVIDRAEELDAALTPALDRSLAGLDPVERMVLRIGVYELSHCPDVPVRVVINEAIELAKVFGAEQGHKYINGVLDRLAKQLRGSEL